MGVERTILARSEATKPSSRSPAGTWNVSSLEEVFLPVRGQAANGSIPDDGIFLVKAMRTLAGLRHSWGLPVSCVWSGSAGHAPARRPGFAKHIESGSRAKARGASSAR